MFRNLCADGWQRHPAAGDTGKTVVPSACFASSQPPLCVALEEGRGEAAAEAEAGDCVTKTDVFDAVGFAGGCRKC